MRLTLPLLLCLASCTVTDPLFCDDTHPCELSSDRPFCDLTGTTVESEGIPKTCVGWPWDAGSDAPACVPELCDGEDNDCDSDTDEDWPELAEQCTSGLGACVETGFVVCTDDHQGTRCSAIPGTPGPAEICANGVDDDCDGPVDEDCPTAVVPRWPWNGATTGSIHATSATLAVKPLRPTFKWDAIANATSYELQVDASCTTPGFATCEFPTPVLAPMGLLSPNFTPTSDLPVSTTAPVGRRYYWRARACNAVGCGYWSPVRYVDVGRQSSDFNGDGFADVAVGAPGYDTSAAATDVGRVYVYYGGTGAALDTTVDAIRTGTAAGNWFGYSVGIAGDVNADGYGDLIVGAYAATLAGMSNAGRAYVYLGGPTFDLTPDVLDGEGAGDWFATSVSAGDVNGDGYSDIIVGIPQSTAAGPAPGLAKIFFGSSGTTFDITADVNIPGPADGDFGSSVSGGADLNGDGFADVVVGADRASVGGASSAGRAYVFFGATSVDTVPVATLDGVGAGDNFGISVAVLRDVNGDLFGDLVVGAWQNDATGADAGRAYVYLGSSGVTFDSGVDTTLGGFAAGGHYGLSVACAGDVNADGYADVLVGAESIPVGGQAYFYYGGPGGSLDTSTDGVLIGESPADSFGNRVGGSRDTNGDGYDDVIVGAWAADPAGVASGRAYLFRGGSGFFNATADGTVSGSASGDYFGTGVGTGL